jgi:lipid-binding SYLF domain-containing protein
MGFHARRLAVLMSWITAIGIAFAAPVWAVEPDVLNRDGAASVKLLREKNLVAEKLASTAKGILVFPSIVKAGFMFGGQIGTGVMLKADNPDGYYSSIGASYGFQAGIQKFGYALFFMDDDSLKDFETSSGFEIGVGPSVVVVDAGAGIDATTTTVRKGIYAFIFDQKGLMAGVGLKGSNITKIRN